MNNSPPIQRGRAGSEGPEDGAELRRLFGRRLRAVRRSRDLTQEELAEKAGLSPEYVSRIERGLASPSFDAIAGLARALQAKPKELFDFSPGE